MKGLRLAAAVWLAGSVMVGLGAYRWAGVGRGLVAFGIGLLILAVAILWHAAG